MIEAGRSCSRLRRCHSLRGGRSKCLCKSLREGRIGQHGSQLRHLSTVQILEINLIGEVAFRRASIVALRGPGWEPCRGGKDMSV